MIGKVTGAKIVAVDVGIKKEVPMGAGVIIKKIKNGTDNMAKGPAMSREEAIQSIEVGIEIANEEIQKGVNLLVQVRWELATPLLVLRSCPF